MMIMGAMMLIVLPLFLFVSARMIARSSFGHKPVGYVSEAILYFCAAFCIFGLFVLIHQIIVDA